MSRANKEAKLVEAPGSSKLRNWVLHNCKPAVEPATASKIEDVRARAVYVLGRLEVHAWGQVGLSSTARRYFHEEDKYYWIFRFPDPDGV